MLGAGVQLNRSRDGDDRFYSVARARHGQNFSRRPQNEVNWRRSRRDVLPPSESSSLCNLERFLESVTPSVQAQYLSKMTSRDWRTCNVEYRPFFLLDDLWASFKEWSVYGVGVPLLLNDSDTVVQYYVPYLSGIQLYADLSESTTKLRRLGEESDGEYLGDSSSDGSSDNEQENSGSYHSGDKPLRVGQLSQEGFSSDEGESGSSEGCLLFEYLARDQPYCFGQDI